MKLYEIQVLARARREYAAALAWWRIKRLAAPNLLRDEMHAARQLLSEFPEAGEPGEQEGGEVRRLLLRGSGYHVFYRIDHDVRRVQILSVWHAQRLPPDL